MSAKKTPKTPARKGSDKAAIKSLTASVSQILAHTNTPIPATKLQPIIEAMLSVGGGFVDQLTEELADKIADNVEAKLAGKIGEIRFVRE